MQYPRAVNRLAAPLIALSLLAVACDKSETPATTAPADEAPPADPIDQATGLLLTTLAEGDYDGLHDHCVDPLHHDLSAEAFHDLSAIVQWLGAERSREVVSTDMSHGGGQRWYTLQFEQGGTVDLEVSIEADGKLVGFEFSGNGYADGEHGVIAEQWREFKVYDFAYLDTEGSPLPSDAPIPGTRVDYEIVVGGIEALLGEHHLTVEKIVLDSDGNEVFHQPIEYDVKFASDASGIPRGTVRGYLEVPGPGRWEMDLVITDRNSGREMDYRHAFETTAP